MNYLEKNKKDIIKLILFTVTIIFAFINIKSIAIFFLYIIKILMPFIIGIFIAFVLNVLLNFIENKLFKKFNSKKWIKLKNAI